MRLAHDRARLDRQQLTRQNLRLRHYRLWHSWTHSHKGSARATAENLSVQFKVADAEALPFDDASFDGVVSTFGVMFAPNQAQAAAELMRVCKPGGKIGMANWTPSSFIGQLFKTLGKHVAAPAGVVSPAFWGQQDWLTSQFSETRSIDITMRHFNFRYRDPDHFIEVFRTLYGPVHKAFMSLDGDAQMALQTDILALLNDFNEARDASLTIPGEYAEVVITR